MAQLLTGRHMPDIGFGTWKISNSDSVKLVQKALEVGYRLIDTAYIYHNEQGVGAGIRASGLPREEVFVTTKLWTSDLGYESGLAAFERSLRLLGLEYVDLYLIHWPSSEDRHEAWRALEKIQQDGRAKAIGVSNYSVGHVKEVLEDSQTVPAVNQIELHPFNYRQQKSTLDFCAQQGIIVEAYSPLTRGHALNHTVVSAIAKATGKTNAQVLLRWCVQHNTVPIPKTTHKERMVENFDIFDFELSRQHMEALDSLA